MPIALVTGASSGIGKSFAHDLARAAELASRFDVLSRGRIVASAKRDEMHPNELLGFYRAAINDDIQERTISQVPA